MANITGELGVLKGLSDGLAKTKDLEGCLDVLQEALQNLGWRRLVYGWKSPGTYGECLNVPVLTREFPKNWDRNWSKHSAHDPYFEAAFVSQNPVRWADVKASLSDLKAKQQDCIHYIDDLGLNDGLTIPVCVSGRRFAFVTALDYKEATSGNSLGMGEGQVELIKLIAHFFDNHILGVSANSKGLGVHLSPREKECLYWTAQGKTVDEIGAITGVSSETTRVYVKRIISKMNATNKTHAVAKAMHLGLVTIN